jgi:hypothetical protein
MLRYGLLLRLNNDLVSAADSNSKADATSSSSMFAAGYLVPSLFKAKAELKEKENKQQDDDLSLNSFFLGFYASRLMEVGSIVDTSEMKSNGFLPNGFFERLLCRMIGVCLNESPTQAADWSKNIQKDTVLLTYKGQRFRMSCLLSENMIRVDVFGYNPVPIYFLLSENIEIVCEESYQSLKCMTLLSLMTALTGPQFIKLDALQSCISEMSTFSLPPQISVSQLKEKYNVWFFNYKQTLALSGYDIFLSYRQNDQDSALVKCLFNEFSYYNISSERYSPVSVFLDGRRLQDGEDFRESFVTSLLQSKIVVPIVTVEALKRMIHHNPAEVDNLLLEWILALHFCESSSGLKVIPIVFGSYSLVEDKDVTAAEASADSRKKKKVIKEIKGINDPHSFSCILPHSSGNLEILDYIDVDTVNVLISSPLPGKMRVIPELTLTTADVLLKKNRQKGLSEELKNHTIDQIVSKLLLFQGIFLSSRDLPSSRCVLKEFAGKQVERLMNTLLTVYRDTSCPHPSRTDDDYFFYNQKREKKEDPSATSSSPDVIDRLTSYRNRDYVTAFSYLEPKMSIIPNLWSSLLKELHIEEVDDLKNRNQCLVGLAGLLHEIPFSGFCSALRLDTSSFDIKLDVSAEKLEAVYIIISQPKKSSCPKCWKALLEELSITDANDLFDVEPTVLSGILGLLKATQAKAVRDLLNV